MESEENFRQKQSLLQKEIIDKNYDKTSFINYCLSKKENGDDLNNWTLEELTEVVKEFAKNQKDNQPQENNQKEEEINQENVEKIEKFNAEEHKNFKEKVITCRKLEKTQLNNNENRKKIIENKSGEILKKYNLELYKNRKKVKKKSIEKDVRG